MKDVLPLSLTFGNRLNAQSWNMAMAGFLAEIDGPVVDLSGKTIHIDLAETGFADFVTLGHLLVFIDMVASTHGKVVLRLASQEHADGPHETESAARRQRQRQQCRLFLKQSGFTTAVHAVSQARSSVEIIDGWAATPFSLADNISPIDDDQVEDPRPPRKLRRVLPYRWLSVSDETQLRPPYLDLLETALTDIGLPSETSAAVAEGLLSELIDNIGEHAHHKVLVGVCIVAPESYLPQIDDFNLALHPLVDWAGQGKSLLARVFVGSAGGSRALGHVVEHLLGTRLRPWRAAQIVRSYQGGLIVTSGGGSCGVIFEERRDGTVVHGNETPAVPGSTVECDLLLSPRAEAILSDHELEAPMHTVFQERANLSSVTVTMRPNDGIGSADLVRVQDQLRGLTTTASLGLVLAVSTDFGDRGPGRSEIMSTLRQVLDVASSANCMAALVVVLPGVNRRLLSLAVDDLLSEESQFPPTPPILLVAPDNRHYWLGGDSAVRTVLGELSSSGREYALTELTRRNSTSDIQNAVRWIHERTMLLHIDAGHVRLKVNPEDAVDALIVHLAQQMKDAIDSANGPGVHRGRFLTPDLRTTSRWCDIHELLAHTQTEQLAGFALACKAKSTVREIDPTAPPSVLRLGTVARELVSAFARSLTGSERYFNSAGSLRLDRASGTLSQATQVLIITGLVVAEDDLAIALDELVALGMTAVAIAAVVDARKEQQSGTYASEMPFHASRLPLISLTAVDIDADDEASNASLIAVDPLLERPNVAVSKPALRTLVNQDDYVETLKRTRAARLAHIARPAGRHYTAYVDPTLLFRDGEWVELFNQRAVHEIIRAQDELKDGKGIIKTVCITYPAETTDNIAEVARGLGVALAGVRKIQTPLTTPVPRAVLGTHWLLPASVSFPVAEHMVVLDSATGSGRTIQQMLRVAAAPYVRLITCIVLLNGLDELDALALQQITTIGRTPVRLYFVARSAVSSLDARDCDVCELRRAYESIPLLAPLPPRLDFQRNWMLRNLTPRSKRRAFEEEAADLTGMHIGQNDCVEYLRWKHDLREAATSTLRRRHLIGRLRRARSRPQVGDALVRLLSAEGSWLQSAPLNLTSVRSEVAGLATGLVVGEAAMSIDPSLRVQALLLLAAVQPFDFIGQFAELLKSNRDHQLVTGQILLEALRLIVGPDAPWRTSREALVQRFIHELSIVENDMRERVDSHSEEYGLATLFEIRYLISHARRRLLPIPTDKQSAWAGLRNYRRSVDEHTYQNVIFRLIARFQYLAKGVPVDRQATSKDWRKCVKFLTLDVLPNLVPLREPLLSSWVLRELTGADVRRWEDVVKGRGQQKLDELTMRIEAILESVNKIPSTPVSTDELIGDLRWWNRFFLTAHADPGVSDDSAFLTEIVQRCPISPIVVLEDAFTGADVTGEYQNNSKLANLSVFCPDDILRDAFTHIRMNAELYHRVLSGKPRFSVEVLGSDDSESIEILIFNTDSASNGLGGGKGLRTQAEKLAVFGGDLKPVEDVPSPWTYGVSVSLERWRMI